MHQFLLSCAGEALGFEARRGVHVSGAGARIMERCLGLRRVEHTGRLALLNSPIGRTLTSSGVRDLCNVTGQEVTRSRGNVNNAPDRLCGPYARAYQPTNQPPLSVPPLLLSTTLVQI